MCSIAGIVNDSQDRLQSMLRLQEHRGPDGTNMLRFENFHIGMSRLQIIDLVSTGLTLFQKDCLTLSYNGEIYNYLELRADLESDGVLFQTNSDTEVVLEAFRKWGLDCFDRFNGMFAIAIFDEKTGLLTLARDIAGEKPLYLYRRGRVFAFASEAKAFSRNFDLSERQNFEFYDAFQHCSTETQWSEVDSLRPATFLVYDTINNQEVQAGRYWDFSQRTIDLKSADEELEDLLDQSVNLRTRSDVPYGLYFSGGLDSSLISTFHKFDKQYYFDNDQDWEKDFSANIATIAWHLDFPVGSLSSYPLWKLAQRASKDVTVVLSGEGADEIFGGYVRYLPVAREYFLRSSFPSYNSYLFKKYFRFDDYAPAFAALTTRQTELADVAEAYLKPYFEKFEDPINAMGFADFELVMPSLLQMGDRMSSSFSLENRCPFLDKRIIEFGFSLPPELKIQDLEQKIMLRRIAKRRGLSGALAMEKKGLTIKYNSWSKGNPWDRSAYFKELNKHSIARKKEVQQ